MISVLNKTFLEMGLRTEEPDDFDSLREKGEL